MEKNKLLALIGKKIRKCRETKGFSQEQFSLESDFERSYYGRIERGEKNITILNLIKIALILDVEPWELLPDKNEINS
jgi:transcriptional regulator with XRE-family HTH domain